MSGYCFRTRLARKDPNLPRFILIPAKATDGASSTFVANIAINGSATFRRSVRLWRKGRPDVWFLELTKQQCDRLGVDTGDRIKVEFSPAEQVPSTLIATLEATGLCAVWKTLSSTERRKLSEHVFDAARPETARQRIAKIVAMLANRSL